MALFNRIKLYFYPIKNGESFYGDPLKNIIGRQLEYVLFGLKDINGNLQWRPLPSDDCYRLTLIDEKDGFYLFNAEILCLSSDDFKSREWKTRTQPRKINKESFKRMVVSGYFKRIDP